MKKENIGVRKDEKPVKGETFRVNFSQASDARELDELIDHIHETLGTRTRPEAAMKMAYLARRQLDLMATGIMPGSQYAPMFNAMNKCLFEGTLSAFLIVRDVIEGYKKRLVRRDGNDEERQGRNDPQAPDGYRKLTVRDAVSGGIRYRAKKRMPRRLRNRDCREGKGLLYSRKG